MGAGGLNLSTIHGWSGAAFGLVALASAGAAAPAHAQSEATATTRGSTSISVPAALMVTQSLRFSFTPSSLTAGQTVTSMSLSGVNANYALIGGQTASISVPATLDVTRVGGTESITVRTIMPDGSLGPIIQQPVAVVGTLDDGELSFSVGGAVTVQNDLKPGEYEGVLTVIAQFD